MVSCTILHSLPLSIRRYRARQYQSSELRQTPPAIPWQNVQLCARSFTFVGVKWPDEKVPFRSVLAEALERASCQRGLAGRRLPGWPLLQLYTTTPGETTRRWKRWSMHGPRGGVARFGESEMQFVEFSTNHQANRGTWRGQWCSIDRFYKYTPLSRMGIAAGVEEGVGGGLPWRCTRVSTHRGLFVWAWRGSWLYVGAYRKCMCVYAACTYRYVHAARTNGPRARTRAPAKGWFT